MIKLEYMYGHNGNGVKNLINLLNQEATIFFIHGHILVLEFS